MYSIQYGVRVFTAAFVLAQQDAGTRRTIHLVHTKLCAVPAPRIFGQFALIFIELEATRRGRTSLANNIYVNDHVYSGGDHYVNSKMLWPITCDKYGTIWPVLWPSIAPHKNAE